MLKFWHILFVFFLIGGAYASRAPWLTRDIWNLDEGSTFTMAEQVLHGGVIYRDAADNRSPLVPYLKAAVTFSYRLDEKAYADDNGQRRSDGIEIAVAFEAAGGGRAQRLFDRLLDPFARPADRGLQTNRVVLPPGQPGRLIFVIDPGPQNNTSYDRAYWTEIRGEPAP